MFPEVVDHKYWKEKSTLTKSQTEQHFYNCLKVENGIKLECDVIRTGLYYSTLLY